MDKTNVAARIRATSLALAMLATVPGAFAATTPVVPVPPPGIAPRAPGLGVEELDQRQADALAALRAGAASSGLVARFDGGNLRFLHGQIPAAGADAPSRARSFLDTYGKDLLRLGPNSELRLLRTDPATGLAAFRQRYRGLPVVGGELQVFTHADGIYAVLGSVMPGDGLDVTPTLDEHEVLQLVEKHGGTLLAPPQLAVSYVRERIVGAAGNVFRRTPRLVWIVPCIKDGHGHTMFYDAHSGEVLREVSLDMDSAAAFDDYDADWYDANSAPAPDFCQDSADGVVEAGDEDGLLSPYPTIPDYVTAWTHTRRAYVFYYDFFGRVSYDDSNGTITGNNESGETDNAMWRGGCDEIDWGPGYASSDTSVHELTHGVTHYTSELAYENESGALNESFSDVMAAVADDVGGGRWVHGEDNVNGNGPNRSLENPDRDHYQEFLNTSSDYGGVHTNSGIGNKAAFLLSEGGIHPQNGYPVTGIGRVKVGRLLYAAYTSVSSEADYDDLRNTAVAIASFWAQYGFHSYTPSDVCSVKNAYQAVGVDGSIFNGGPSGGDLDCDGVGNSDDADNDGDGIGDGNDNCRIIANPSQADADDDYDDNPWPEHFGGDACDADDDNDGVLDETDNCPTVINQAQQDANNNGIGDACDDRDGDLDGDLVDNCPDVFNPDQADTGGLAGFGDACDGDADGDGVFNADGDNCPLVANADQADADNDFFGDVCDGCPNEADIPAAFGFDGRPLQPDTDGDGTPDQCDGSLKAGGGSDIGTSQTPTPGSFSFLGQNRVALPLDFCGKDCEVDAPSSLVGSAFALDLDGLPPGVTAMVTDENGKAWARSRTLSDGSRRLYFSPRGDRRYFLTLQRGAGAPESGDFAIRSFLEAPTLVSPADLSVTVTDTPDPVSSGADLRYTVQAANETFSMAEGVALRVTLPTGAQLKSAPGCAANAGELVCDIGELAAGARAQREIVVTANGCPSQPPSLTARVESGTVDPVPGNDVASATTQIADGTGPGIRALSANPNLLWPPNHRMRKVDLSVTVADACDATPRCRITGVTSNEAIEGPGDGNTVTDWLIVDADTVNLRAERSGKGTGREYRVAIECTDTAGNASRRSTTVRVPYEQ